MSVLTKERVREIFMAHGFTIKEGRADLKAYVYAAADALVDAAIVADRAARAEPKAVGKVDSSCVGGMYWFFGPQREDGELLYTAPPAAPVVRECHWSQEDDVHMPGTWDGACGAKWSFIDGGPVENEIRYCPNCGGRVTLAAAPAPSQEPTT